MKKYILIGLILLKSASLYSQVFNNDISFELRYPFTVGDNFLNNAYNEGYSGILDMGLDYSILKTGNLKYGIQFNTSFLKIPDSAKNNFLWYAKDISLTIFSPKIKVDYTININKVSIIPQIAIGYSFYRFKTDNTITNEEGILIGEESTIINEKGLSFKGGSKLAFNKSERLSYYFHISYEYTRLEKLEGSTVNNYTHIINPGIGLIWKFKYD